MSESDARSRRDWFRLRLFRQTTESAELTPDVLGQESSGLAPIEHPPNHDGLDLSELPPMREAMLTRDDVTRLFDDIEQLATDIQLMQRSSRSSRTQAASVDASGHLKSAADALLSGQVPRLQIRYRWQDSLWIDTLENTPAGYRLIRIAHNR